MEKEFQKGGGESIAKLIALARELGSDIATVTGNHLIEKAIRIPSGFTLILDGCHLKMEDGVYDNLFVNEHHGTEIGRTLEGRDRGIRIIGKNGAFLDGGNYNGLSEKTQNRNGLPPVWKNNLILFTNVEDFEISGISCRNQRWWAMNFIYCAHGKLCNVDFCACDVAIDERGNSYHGLLRERSEEALVKNADGIDLRQGCHHVCIENVTGFTEDDTIALTALNGSLEKAFSVEGLPADLCHVTVKNVHASSFCSIVRLLNQGAIPLHHVEIEDVFDTSRDSPYMDRGIYAVRIGDNRLYGDRHSTAEETHHVSIKNVYGRGKHVIGLRGEIGNLTIEDVRAEEGTNPIMDRRGAVD